MMQRGAMRRVRAYRATRGFHTEYRIGCWRQVLARPPSAGNGQTVCTGGFSFLVQGISFLLVLQATKSRTDVRADVVAVVQAVGVAAL